MQGLPRWVTNDAATQKAYDALVEKVCPCVVVVHSQGGSFGFNAAVTAPDKIKALVAIEPSGAPDSANVDVGKLKGVPHLIVWGDFRDKVAVWQRLPIAPTRYRDALVAAGGKADNFDLPAMGIKDNTHMLMMDRNSDERRQADPRLDRQAGTGELTPAPARILSNLHCGRGDAIQLGAPLGNRVPSPSRPAFSAALTGPPVCINRIDLVVKITARNSSQKRANGWLGLLIRDVILPLMIPLDRIAEGADALQKSHLQIGGGPYIRLVAPAI
jgi:hypothetical protein